MSNRTYLHIGLAISAIILTGVLLVRGQQPQHTHGSMTQKQMEEMNERGDKEMGFDRLKTTHHFLLANDGGTIQVEVNNPKDKESRDQIRQHLRHTAMLFVDGNFKIPMIIHAKTPPGSEVMQQLKAEISYTFRETARGALIRITTRNASALQAIHEFLRFQIREHTTGDPLDAPDPAQQ